MSARVVRIVVAAGVVSTLVTAACTGVLGIDGSYESVVKAICDRTTQLCGAQTPALTPFDLDPANCTTGIVPSGQTQIQASTYLACADAGDCYTYLDCLAADPNVRVGINFSKTPCTSIGQPCIQGCDAGACTGPAFRCCTSACVVPDGGGTALCQ